MKLSIQLNTKGSDALFHVKYKNGKFHRLEHRRGNYNDAQYKNLMVIIPIRIADLPQYKMRWSDKVIYKQVQETKSLFKKMMDSYATWYWDKTELEPRLNATSGNSLKQIITHLKKQSKDDEEVLQVFQLMLDRWEFIPEFYQQQKELRQINSNINIILSHVKERTAKNQRTDVPNDFREGFKA